MKLIISCAAAGISWAGFTMSGHPFTVAAGVFTTLIALSVIVDGAVESLKKASGG